jgi:hypothetical protein
VAAVVSAAEQQQQQELRVSGRPADPICIGIEARDPMYSMATHNVKQSIECEEARAIEGQLAELYKSESGRSRGWTKTKLEEFLVPRAAVGGRVAAKQAFDWSKIWSEKTESAILDFLCLAKGIRVAVWNTAQNTVGVWPAADRTSVVKTPTLYHVSLNGAPISNKSIRDVLAANVIAPLSVEHSLEKLSLGELEDLAGRLGMTAAPIGKKTDKVRAIATFRTKQRLRGAE